MGAGEAVLIDALRRRGREAVGLERDSRRQDMRDEPLERVEGEWAAVVFWHSLEHLPDPGGAIREAARLLRPGGMVVIAVPNTDSLQAQTFGDRWLHLDPPLHLVHLSERALRSRLTACGFEVERVSHVRGGQIVIGWLDGLVGMPSGASAACTRHFGDRRLAAARFPQAGGRPRWRPVLLLLPLAMGGAALEVGLRRSGTVYVEARLA